MRGLHASQAPPIASCGIAKVNDLMIRTTHRRRTVSWPPSEAVGISAEYTLPKRRNGQDHDP